MAKYGDSMCMTTQWLLQEMIIKLSFGSQQIDKLIKRKL